MSYCKKIMPYIAQIPFFVLVGVVAFMVISGNINTIPYIAGFIEWKGWPDCQFNFPTPPVATIPFWCIFIYAAFQLKRTNVMYATLLLIGALLPLTAVLLFLPYQAYLLRHKNKMIAVLCLAAFAVLMYCLAWSLDFFQ